MDSVKRYTKIDKKKYWTVCLCFTTYINTPLFTAEFLYQLFNCPKAKYVLLMRRKPHPSNVNHYAITNFTQRSPETSEPVVFQSTSAGFEAVALQFSE